MPKLDPERLIALREAKGITRQKLADDAGVSERQLARIEGAGEARSVRPNTLKRLARALEVDCGVLTREEPLPDYAQEEPVRGINPAALKGLRKKRGILRKDLAQKSGVSVRHIARLESSRASVQASQANTIASLARALQVKEEKLTSDVGIDATAGQDVQMGFKVSPQLRLAYDLIRHRYGISRVQLVELAPLLFALFAEGCLAWRRECLQEVEDAVSRLRELGEMSQLGFANLLFDVDKGCGVEADSIEQADLLGDVIRRDGWFSGSEYSYAVTPFADYLCKQAEDLKTEGVVDFSHRDKDLFATVGHDQLCWGAEPYQVCRDDLAEIAGGSKVATWALAHGDVLLSKIPKELLAPEAMDTRIKWLESKVSDETRKHMEEWEEHVTRLAELRETDEEDSEKDEPR